MTDMSDVPSTLDRMVRAVEKVRERLTRATAALEKAGVPYAVVGGNAVAAWVAQIDESAVRNTQDVDILLRRDDLDAASAALTAVGFKKRHIRGITMFLDGDGSRLRDAVNVLFAGERVRPDDVSASPDVAEWDALNGFRTLQLEPLVRLHLTSFALDDRVDLQDMLDVGLIDQTWCSRFSPELASRLQSLIDNPDPII
jgi:hypothetical protein